jgi:hypothetical protein
MVNEPRYVRQKLEIAVSMLNARSGTLGQRVRDAWEEMSVLDAEDFADLKVRADFQNLEATRELYVISTQTVNLPPERLRDVSVRIKRIHDATVR